MVGDLCSSPADACGSTSGAASLGLAAASMHLAVASQEVSCGDFARQLAETSMEDDREEDDAEAARPGSVLPACVEAKEVGSTADNLLPLRTSESQESLL